MMLERRAFGLRLRQIRERRGMTSKELAERARIDWGYLRGIEVGAKNVPAPEALVRLSNVLEVSVDDLLRPGDVPPSGTERALALAREAVERVQGIPVRYRGWVPADMLRWTSTEDEAVTVMLPPEWLDGLSPERCFVARVSGDYLRVLGIPSGHFVLCVRDLAPRDDDIVLVRIEDAGTLQQWAERDDAVELRDGDGAVVATLGRHRDHVVVEGVVVRSWSPPRRPVR